MDLLFLLLFGFDGIAVGVIVSALCKKILGDSPLGRLFRLLFSVGGGIFYAYMCIALGYGEADVSLGTFILIAFAPVAAYVLMAIIGYMFKSNENNDGEGS